MRARFRSGGGVRRISTCRRRNRASASTIAFMVPARAAWCRPPPACGCRAWSASQTSLCRCRRDGSASSSREQWRVLTRGRQKHPAAGIVRSTVSSNAPAEPWTMPAMVQAVDDHRVEARPTPRRPHPCDRGAVPSSDRSRPRTHGIRMVNSPPHDLVAVAASDPRSSVSLSRESIAPDTSEHLSPRSCP